MFAVVSLDQIGFDLSVGHMYCRVPPSAPIVTGAGHMIRPSVAWLSPEHKAALEGLSDQDHRKAAYLRCTTVDMGPVNAQGAHSLDKQNELAAASVPQLVSRYV